MVVTIPGIELRESIYESGRCSVVRGRRLADDRAVVVKLIVGDPLRVRSVARLRSEHERMAALDSPSIPQALGFHHEPGHFAALVMSDLGALSLEAHLQARPGPLPLADALTLGIAAAEALEVVHRGGLIHYDVKPHNLICRPDPWRLQIIDFGLALQLSVDEPELLHSDLIGTLPYMSPEQTGRMSCPVDHRSDLYSLGVVLYRMLTGVLPLRAEDLGGWIHAHLAQRPRPASDLVPELPDVVVAIVERALAKDREQRYQSAHGLASDLRRCQALLDTRGVVSSFAIGRDDRSSRFRVPPTLLGRERELARLDALLARGSTPLAPVFVTIVGEAGIGKTALLDELQRRAIEGGRALVLRASFEPGAVTPLHAVVAIFAALVDHALALPERELAELRARLLAGLGRSSARVLVDMLPGFARVIGDMPAPPELGPIERRHIQQLVVERVLACVARPTRSLVLLLDDLQWADSTSLALLGELLDNEGLQGLRIFATLRSEGIEGLDPRLLAKRRASIELGPLAPDSIVHLVEQTVLRRDADTHALAQLLAERTGGRALHVRQALAALYEQGLVRFDADARVFRWDLDQVRDAAPSEDLAELLAARQAALPPASARLVELAACIGPRFDLATLASASGQAPGDCVAGLWPALTQGSILADSTTLLRLAELDRALPLDDELVISLRFRFAHERVRRAALARVAEPACVHLQIARALLRHLDPDQRAARCFEIADHLHVAGDALLAGQPERAEAIALFWSCGVKALARAAHADALTYLEIAGDALTPADAPWFAITLERARALGLVGRQAEAEALHEPLRRAAANDEQRLALLRLIADQATVSGAFARGIEVCVEALALLGVEAPRDDAAAGPRVAAALAQIDRDRAGRSFAELRAAPPMHDERARSISALLDDLSVLSYLAGQWALNAWTNASIASVSLRHGHASISGLAYALLGLLLAMRGDHASAHEYGRLGVALSDEYRDGAVFGRAYIAYYALVAHGELPLADIVPKLYAAHELALEGGDLTGSSHSLLFGDAHKLAAGGPLAELRDEIVRHLPSLRRHDPTSLAGFYLPHVVHACAWLLDGEPEALFGVRFDADEFLAEHAEVEIAKAWYWASQTKLDALAEVEIDQATLEARVACVERGVAGQLHVFEVRYYAALILLAGVHAGRLVDDARGRALGFVGDARERLARVAERAPVNFDHRVALLDAELLRAEGADLAAARRYEHAIAAARRGGMLDQEALALRRQGEACLAAGLPSLGHASLRAAYERYLEWGATRVARLLHERHPWLASREPLGSLGSIGSLGSLASIGSLGSIERAGSRSFASQGSVRRGLDLDALGRAARAIGSTTRVTELLDTLCGILRQHVGAERCAILLVDETSREVVMAAHAGADPDAPPPGFARSIVDFVRRSGELLVVEHAALDSRWSSDEHVQRTRPKSLVCAPLGTGERIVGVVYAENNLTARAFRSEQIELLRVVLAQAAISLDNTRLFEALGLREAYFRSLLDNAPDVVLSVDRAHHIRFANRGESRFAGRSLVGATVDQLVGEGDRERARAAIDQVFATGKPGHFETSVERPGGTRLLSARLGPIRDASGVVEQVSVIASDITEQRKLEAELRHAQRMEAVGRLASGVAHDFNNLLTVMFAAAELGALSCAPSSDAHAQFAEVLAAAERAERITRQLLMFSRKQVIATRVVDLGVLVGNLAKLLARVLGEDVALALELDPMPCPVLGDPGQLEQVVMNLAVNARDAMPRGGTLTITTQAAQPDREPRRVGLRVRDEGTGMDAATQARIFEPFFTTKPVGSGTGLGLATVRAVIDGLGGTIAVESVLGQGTTFAITLPESAELEQVESDAGTSGPRSLSLGRRVLLVEDDEATRRSVAAMLTQLGWSVAAAPSGRRALELARELGVIDLLLTDVVLPQLDGHELAGRLLERDPELAVLYMSGYDSEALHRHRVDPSQVALLTKPFTIAMLAQAIDLALSQEGVSPDHKGW